MPQSITSSEIKKTITVIGLTPESFLGQYSSAEFNFHDLMATFARYCIDYNNDLAENQPSMALEFGAKILFEYGPYMRTERKSKRDKAIRFRFPYKREYPDNPEKKAE